MSYKNDTLYELGETVKGILIAPLLPLLLIGDIMGPGFLAVPVIVVAGGGVASLVHENRVRYIEPQPVEKSADDLNKLESYKADEAFKLLDDMVAKNGYIDQGKLTPELEKKIMAEIADYLNRFEKNHSNLANSYAQYYSETAQEIPEVISKTMTNKTGWNYQDSSFSAKKFRNNYKTEDLYTELAKLSFKEKAVEEKLLGNKNTAKLKDSSVYKDLNNLSQTDVINLTHDIISKSSHVLSGKQTGTPDMCAGLLLESLNRDVMNNILTNCSAMGIDVLGLFNTEKRQAMLDQILVDGSKISYKVTEQGEVTTIDGINFIIPNESAPTINGPEIER